MQKLHWYIMFGLGLWWIAHIYEGDLPLEKANRTCDPIYWVGKFSNREIVSGFTNNESQSYQYSQGVASDLGKACFYLSSHLFKAVNPVWSYDQAQMFNNNELKNKKPLLKNK